MIFHPVDIIKLVLLAAYVIIILAIEDISPAVQDALIIGTHVFALTSVYVLFETLWLALTILIGVVFSILAHLAYMEDWDIARFEPFDIAFANLTLMLIIIIVVFKEIPLWTLPLVITVTVANTVFYDISAVYIVSSGFVNLGFAIYVFYRLCKPSPLRENTFMVIALLLGITGSVFFITDGNYGDKDYGKFHSIWHVCSYSAIYFAARSIVSEETNLRKKRLEFGPTIQYTGIAYQ